MTDQARVAEVDLGRLGQPLAKILSERLGQKQQPRDFQDANPGVHGRHRHAQGTSQVRLVEDLPRARCEQAKEATEDGQIADVAHRAHVAFQVGLHVGTKPGLGQRGPGQDLGKPPQEGRNLRMFLMREGQQLEHGHSPCHALGHALHQGGFLRASEQPAALAVRRCIDATADIGQ